MPHNGRNHQRRHRGSKDNDRSTYSREDDYYYSRSRQSDHRYKENVSGKHSYDVDSREVSSSSSSSRAVDSSWQRSEYSGGYQDRYANKSRRDDYEAVAAPESRETEVGWSVHRSNNDADLYPSHPQREEWPPPPRFDSNFSSSTAYQDQYHNQPPASSSYSQQQSWDDIRQHEDRIEQDQYSHRQSSRGADARWQREAHVVYHQEQDNGWDTRRSETDKRQNWDENSVGRQWEPAQSWNSSQRGYDSSQQSHRSHDYSQQNGHRRKNSRKSDSNGKANGSNREDDDLNKYVFFS
ncbi:hypothetical protein J3R30DRAFT_2866444 [Lentinula aciculospora]|uniref:Uncharacterized protein n=1 Tax=Lentinula aciculospora TaxID=153920 RepID=A0A9W9ABE6_9AGAR|nr:hypothetical protein J3R30DRAFT_2866444 [Lentinula aciculospora]